ncbi:MAG: phytanoyl-CoA dioxygenase family protein [Mariniblastus sp.]|nr:phytanoyl-CoA dioxygenase family protein [Mariniblastus sp.]
MNFKKMAEQFWEQGFVVLESFFESEEMDRLCRLIFEEFGESPSFMHDAEFLERSKADVIPWFPQREGIFDFDASGNNRDLQRLTAAILGEEWCEQYTMVMFSNRNSDGQSWHQDCPPENASQFNLNRLVYPHDIDDQTGGRTVVIPGSHRRGVLPAGAPNEDLDGQIVLELNKGTLVLLHGHCWHRVLPINDNKRVSINYRSAPAGTPDDITDVCVYRNMRYRFSTGEVVEERV